MRLGKKPANPFKTSKLGRLGASLMSIGCGDLMARKKHDINIPSNYRHKWPEKTYLTIINIPSNYRQHTGLNKQL